MESVKNWPLLWKVYDHIVAHPEEWNQELFCDVTACGTQFCFAGHAIMIARPDVSVDETGGFRDANGESIDPEDEGARLLGLDDDEVEELFYNMTRHPSEIREIIATWEAEENVRV